MTPKEVATRVLALIEHTDRWLKGAMATDALGVITSPRLPTAHCFCLTGAAIAVTRHLESTPGGGHDFVYASSVRLQFYREMGFKEAYEAVVFNDEEETRHSDVLERVRKVAEQ